MENEEKSLVSILGEEGASVAKEESKPVEEKVKKSKKKKKKKDNEVNEKQIVRHPFFSRGNLIAIGLACFLAFAIIFAGLCINVGDGAVLSKKNPIAILSTAIFGVNGTFEAGGSATISLLLVAIYIPLGLALLLYISRFAKLKKAKWYSFKYIVLYLLALIVCVALSWGLSFVIQSPIKMENIASLSLYLSISMLMGLFIFLFFGIIVGAVVLTLTNYLKLGKPFVSMKEEPEQLVDEEDDDKDVRSNFGASPDNKATVAGEIAAAGGVGNGTGSVVEALADREIVFPGLSKIDVAYGGSNAYEVKSDDIDLKTLATSFRDYLAKKEGLYYDLPTIRFFLAGLSTSHLSILEGVSGTGKSSLPRYFARFIGARVVFLPVQSSWRDKSSILGYWNDFSKRYNETDALLNLYEANYNPDTIYIFVLDEMNISRVEYYFADFLSVLEYPEDEWKLRIMHFPAGYVGPVKLDEGNLQIGGNCYFVGTANQDDSTFTIADKVYDRAISIDFAKNNVPFEPKGDGKEIHLGKKKLDELFRDARIDKKAAFSKEDERTFLSLLDLAYDELGIATGNRIIKQVEEICPVYVKMGGKKEDILDMLFLRKVLRKLEGRFDSGLEGSFRRINAALDDSYGVKSFPKSRKYLQELMKRL